MSDRRGRTFADLLTGLNAGQHLSEDALAAFVDGALGDAAHDRASVHLTTCAACAAEVAAQRQARRIVRSPHAPGMPADLLAMLRKIPLADEPVEPFRERAEANFPETPDGFAVISDSTVIAVTEDSPNYARWGSRLRAWLGRKPKKKTARKAAADLIPIGIHCATRDLDDVLKLLGPPPEPVGGVAPSPLQTLPVGAS